MNEAEVLDEIEEDAKSAKPFYCAPIGVLDGAVITRIFIQDGITFIHAKEWNGTDYAYGVLHHVREDETVEEAMLRVECSISFVRAKKLLIALENQKAKL